MKKLIYASTIQSVQAGFLFNLGNKDFFLESTASNVTDNIARKFVNAICDYKQVSDDLRLRSLNDRYTLNDFKRRIVKAVLKHVDSGKVTFWSIEERNGVSNFPEDDFSKYVVLID